MRSTTGPSEKPLFWLSSSKRDLLAMPGPRGAGTGHGPGVAQYGSKHPIAKAWKGEGPGVFEVVRNFDGDAFRAVYTVRRPKAVYVLHCFQKKVAQRDSDRSDRCGFDQRTAAACARGLRGEVWQSGSLSAD